MTNEQHNKYLGYSFLAYAGIHTCWTIVACVAMFFFLKTFPGRPGDLGPPPEMFAVIFGMVSLFALLFTIPSVIAAYGLLKRKQWARIAGIIAGILAAMSFPIGTAVCVYAMWFLFGTGRDFHAGAQGFQPAELSPGYQTPSWTTQKETRTKVNIPPTGPPDWR